MMRFAAVSTLSFVEKGNVESQLLIEGRLGYHQNGSSWFGVPG